jgi:hypothetical protein
MSGSSYGLRALTADERRRTRMSRRRENRKPAESWPRKNAKCTKAHGKREGANWNSFLCLLRFLVAIVLIPGRCGVFPIRVYPRSSVVKFSSRDCGRSRRWVNLIVHLRRQSALIRELATREIGTIKTVSPQMRRMNTDGEGARAESLPPSIHLCESDRLSVAITPSGNSIHSRLSPFAPDRTYCFRGSRIPPCLSVSVLKMICVNLIVHPWR